MSATMPSKPYKTPLINRQGRKPVVVIQGFEADTGQGHHKHYVKVNLVYGYRDKRNAVITSRATFGSATGGNYSQTAYGVLVHFGLIPEDLNSYLHRHMADCKTAVVECGCETTTMTDIQSRSFHHLERPYK